MRIETLVAETKDEFTKQVLDVLTNMIFRNKDETAISVQQRQDEEKFKAEFEEIYQADDLKRLFTLIWEQVSQQSDECRLNSQSQYVLNVLLLY